MQKLLLLLADALDAIIIAFMAAAASVMLVEEWRATKAYYFIGGWAVGVIVGIAGQRMGVPEGWDILITAVAVPTAPMTIAWLRRRSLLDVLEDVRKRKAKMDDRDTD